MSYGTEPVCPILINSHSSLTNQESGTASRWPLSGLNVNKLLKIKCMIFHFYACVFPFVSPTSSLVVLRANAAPAALAPLQVVPFSAPCSFAVIFYNVWVEWVISHVSSQLMEVIRLGPDGLRVAIHVEKELRIGFVYATIPRQHTEDKTAKDWDALKNHGPVTQIAVQVRSYH